MQATSCQMGPNFPLSTSKKGHTHPFSAHACGQTAEWIKMPLGTEVGLGLGHIVLDGNPAPPRKGEQNSPQFSAHVYCGETVAHFSNW